MASGLPAGPPGSAWEAGGRPIQTPADDVLDRTADTETSTETVETQDESQSAGLGAATAHEGAGLIDARIQSLLVQGQIIAGAIASSATVETDSSITLDPDKLLNLHPGESYGPNEDALYGLDFPINPERVGPILRRLVSPTKTRARIYDRDGVLLVDSRNLFGRGDILRYDLPPPTAEKPGFFERAFIAVRMWL